ncbi:MAG: TonB-dependent receptor [Bacteroidia bacterium]
MKFKHLIIIISSIVSVYTNGQNSLHGKITDAQSGETIPGAVIYLPELKVGTSSDSTGKYYISSLPRGSYEVEVRLLSYATAVKQVTINGSTGLNFSLTASSASSKEVVITALGNVTNTLRSPTPVTVVTHEMFLQESSTNVVDAIATQPGITAITTGPGVSKPEINGLGYNRVLTLFDGVRQEEFQWGDEHGVLIDPYAVNDAEIIRGPASLQFGANAVAGVVNFKSGAFTENGTIQGSVTTEYQTNNGLIGNSEDIGGNNNGFVWDLRASSEGAHCYWDPKDGYVWGTAFNQDNIKATIGLNREWGYTRLMVSFLHKQIEIPDGNRDSATGQFEFDTPQGNPQYYTSVALKGQLIPGTGQVYPNTANYMSYNPDISSYQVLDHYVISWQNSINVGKGRILADIGYTQSHRQEIDTGVVPEENMYVNDIPYSIKYQVKGDTSGLKFTGGFNGMYESMQNGTEPVYPYIGDFEIPNYNLFDIGGFAILEKDYKNLTLSGGLRYDSRVMAGQSMYLANYFTSSQEIVPEGTPGAFSQFLPFNHTYTGFSGSIGATYQLPQNSYIKINLVRSFRAPAINELTSNEVNPGGDLYELGDRNLKPEEGYQGDIAIGNNGRDVNFEVDGFYNYINNFIFSDRLTNIHGGDTTALGKSIFQYKANTAIITGVAAYFNIHPADTKWIEIDNGFTYTYSYMLNRTDSTRYVPWTPAPRLTSEVKFKLKTSNHRILTDTYFKFGLAKYWAQNDIYSAYWTELPSQAYTLYNLGLGTNFADPKTSRLICSLYFNITNLMNIAYADHTARTQYFWAYNSTSNPTNYGKSPAIVTEPNQGIYNMGRNVGFKLVFPVGGHKTMNAENSSAEN